MALSLVASALNFLYYPVTARLLSLQQFGDLQLGVALIMQTAALFTALNVLALYLSASSSKDSSATLNSLERIIVTLSLVIALLTAFFANNIASYFGLRNLGILYLLSVIFMCNIPATTWLGVLQGEGKFISAGVIAVISGTTKIVAASIFILLDYGVAGALAGILFGQLIILPLAMTAHKKGSLRVFSTLNIARTEDGHRIRKHPALLMVMLILAGVAAMGTVDVLMAKATLNAEDAGSFAQASTIAKIPYFAAIPLTLILFQRLLTLNKRFSLSSKNLLVGLLALTGLPVIILTLGPVLFLLLFDTEGSRITAAILTLGFSAYVFYTVLLYGLLAASDIRNFIFAGLLGIMLTIISFGYSNNIKDADDTVLAALFSTTTLICTLATMALYAYTKNQYEKT